MTDIHYDLPEQEYHALPRISKSYLWKLNTVPAAAQIPLPADTPELVIGSATHAYILEGPEAFASRFAVAPKLDRRTKEGKAAWEEFTAINGDKRVVTQDDYDTILAMSDAVRRHPLAGSILEMHGCPEVSALWTDSESGLACKARADLVTPQQVIVDLKTCRDASLRGFLSACTGYGYHVQASWYLEAFRDLADSFLFIAVEKSPPYRCEVYTLDEEFLLKGRERARELINIELACRTNGYPHYTDPGVQTLYAPSYL